MILHNHNTRRAITLLVFLFAFAINSYANVAAINMAKVGYPKSLQADIDYLISNQKLYTHWVPEWKYELPKDEVMAKLTGLYAEIEKLPADNIEATLLLGDIAHFLYNLDNKPYYQKAVDKYQAAQKLDGNDCRPYWFLGNHYALAGVAPLAISTMRSALSHLPQTQASAMFWADYANAFILADMPASAVYAAHQSSVTAGARTYVEEFTSSYKKTMLHAPPADTTLTPKEMWYLKKRKTDKWTFTNWALGFNTSVDSSWSVRPLDFKNGGSAVMIIPPRIQSVSGAMIGFSIMVMAQTAKPDVSMEQFTAGIVAKHPDKKLIALNITGVKNCTAYEITDPNIYPQWGGSHSYIVTLEREQPDNPGMLLEEPMEKMIGGNGQVTYYRSNRKFGRLAGKMRYMIMLDSCEAIKEESIAAFKEFLEKGVMIE